MSKILNTCYSVHFHVTYIFFKIRITLPFTYFNQLILNLSFTVLNFFTDFHVQRFSLFILQYFLHLLFKWTTIYNYYLLFFSREMPVASTQSCERVKTTISRIFFSSVFEHFSFISGKFLYFTCHVRTLASS